MKLCSLVVVLILGHVLLGTEGRDRNWYACSGKVYYDCRDYCRFGCQTVYRPNCMHNCKDGCGCQVAFIMLNNAGCRRLEECSSWRRPSDEDAVTEKLISS